MVEPFLFARFSAVILIFLNQSLTDPLASNILTGFSEETSLFVCYLPARRSVLGKTLQEVLSTARGCRSRALLKTEGTVFPNTDRARPANKVFFFSSVEHFVIRFCVEFSLQPFSIPVYACA